MSDNEEVNPNMPPVAGDAQVTRLLHSLGLDFYAQTFARKCVTLTDLTGFTEEDLKNLGVSKVVDRVKLLSCITGLTAHARVTTSVQMASPVAAAVTPQKISMQTGIPSLKVGPTPVLPQARIAGSGRQLAATRAPAAAPTPPIKPEWRKIGGKFLVISIALHVLFAVAAAYYVVQTITAKRKLTFRGGPPSPNPSQRSLEHKVQMAKKKNTMSAPMQTKRITTTGLAKVALPEMPAMPNSNPATMSKMAGMGGTGFGLSSIGALGTGGGKGGGVVPFFGLRTRNEAALRGIFYDLKQTPDRRPTGMTPQQYAKEITSFLKEGWGATFFSRFYQASDPLYNTQIFMPDMDANKGPTAFGVEKEVQPRMWVVHYSGRVTPGESGVYHFVGQGDDILLVKFDNRLVLVACWNNPTFGIVQTTWKPQGVYTYGWPPNCPSGGLVKGNAMEVRAGVSYLMEVLIGEQPGGRGCAVLLIEKEGATYVKDARGNPILPIFRLADTKMPPLERGESFPPYAPDGPVWKGEAGNGIRLPGFH